MVVADYEVALDWGSVLDIRRMRAAFHRKTTEGQPLVTIGMPTYKRTDTIRRALASLAAQSFRDFVVIVSDNAGQDDNTLEAVREFADRLPEIYLIRQHVNLGAIPNFQFALACASTRYFMWLADDDEISANYLEDLASLLETDNEAVGAMGEWIMTDEIGKREKRRQLKNSSRNLALRLAKYIIGPSDDSFFYGVHRVENLRKCGFDGYFYPNVGVLTNYCYVYLFDLLLQGPVKYSDRAQWICHGSNTTKNYAAAGCRGVKAKLGTLMRRINIHYLYSKKTVRAVPLALVFTLPASLIGFVREFLSFVLGRFRHGGP